MVSQPSILAIVMAGGKGERLYPLTEHRGKPAVPFGGRYRIIDFVLSNIMNSKISACYVLVQYRSQSLIEHLRASWPTRGLTSRDFLTVVPPQMRLGERWYTGTADAVAQNINLIRDYNADLVAIFGADHVYRMDIREMVAYHLEKKADVTVAARGVPLAIAGHMGIIETNIEGRVVGFEEKPSKPRAMPTNPEMAYSSMGNYIFTTEALSNALSQEVSSGDEYDFGKTIIPSLFPQRRIFAYDFLTNTIPGIKPYEEKGYWRDVGTIVAFWQAHMDLLGKEPIFDLNNSHWPILGSQFEGPSARLLSGSVENSLIAGGCVIDSATIRRSVLGRGVVVHPDSLIEDSVIMDYVVIGSKSRLKKVIIDRFNKIPEKTSIGFDPEGDRKLYFQDSSGIAVLPRAGR